MTEVRTTKIGSLLAGDRGISVGVMYPGEDTPDGVPLIRVADIVEGAINRTPTFRIGESVHHQYRRTMLEGGEVLITLVGRPGISVVVPQSMAGWNVARALAVVRLQEPAEARYLTYALASPAVQNTIRNWCNTTVQATLNLKEIKALPVPWPSASMRRNIVEILGSLDDKIELNRRMNVTLEAMAQAIFRDWFVDFGPTRRKMDGATDPIEMMGGLVTDPDRARELAELFPAEQSDDGLPQGWSEGDLGHYAFLNPESWSVRNAPHTIEYVDLANTKWGTIELTTVYRWTDAPSRARRIVRDGDTIVGTVRPGNGSYSYVGIDGLTASTGFAALRPKERTMAPLVYLAATSVENIERLDKLADGGAYPAVRPDVVLATNMPILPLDIVDGFASVCAPLITKVEHNKKENRILAATRDLLLPKLMSGEIRIRDAERMIEAVA